MIKPSGEPSLAVGLLTGITEIRFHLHESFRLANGEKLSAGRFRLYTHGAGVEVVSETASEPIYTGPSLDLEPDARSGSFTICDVVIGIGFHWERREDQTFLGALQVSRAQDGGLVVINRIEIEPYLTSVISSEMSETAHAELLRAHAVVSRSWLLSQLPDWRMPMPAPPVVTSDEDEIVRWYDRENHAGFDVCADDHCQRYQGVTKATTPAAKAAVSATSGKVLTFDGRLCDARYSKSCGGVTERFASAWADIEVPYLAVRYDGEVWPEGYTYPLDSEPAAERWILGRPPSFCSTPDGGVLSRILPGFDQETADFYRWTQRLTQTELRELLWRKLNLDLGCILSLEAVERGDSGRITKLRVRGEARTVVIGKELEIRRALSPSHLYSSAFIIAGEARVSGIPESFTLRGAGWGHGVGLCQIGAAVMAESGYDYVQILRHYFQGAGLERIY